MANEPHNSCARTWASTFTRLTTLNHSLIEAPAQHRDAIEREIAALHDRLLAMPAPDLSAVIAKLHILWDVSIDQPDQAGYEQRQIVQDLQAIQASA